MIALLLISTSNILLIISICLNFATPFIARPVAHATVKVAQTIGINGHARISPAQPHSLVYPDPQLTPGVANPLLHATLPPDPHDKHNICSKAFTTRDYRHTTAAMKAEAYRKYGVVKGQGDCAKGCEIDHSEALEDGGADVQENLWPEPYEPRPGAHEKDRLETVLHNLVCAGKLDLEDAQHEIATDWIASYEKRIGPVPTK
jgi:hypothetical protein